MFIKKNTHYWFYKLLAELQALSVEFCPTATANIYTLIFIFMRGELCYKIYIQITILRLFSSNILLILNLGFNIPSFSISGKFYQILQKLAFENNKKYVIYWLLKNYPLRKCTAFAGVLIYNTCEKIG